MKNSLFITGLAFALLAACAPQSPTTGATGGAGGTGGGRQPAAEGEFCGGIAGILCDEGLRCIFDGDYPDAGGICVRE